MRIQVLVFSMLMTVTTFAQVPDTTAVPNGDSPFPKSTPYAPSIRDSSDSTNKGNVIGQIVNLASAGMNITEAYGFSAQCGSSNKYACFRAASHFAMGAAALAQAAAQKKTAGQADNAFRFTDTGTDTGGYNSDLASGKYDSDYERDLREQEKKTKKQVDHIIKEFSGTTLKPGKPFVYNPTKQTITTPNKTYKVDDFSSPAAMAAAGMSKGMIDAATASQKAIAEKAAKLVSKYKVAGAGSAEEAGGGGGGSAAVTADAAMNMGGAAGLAAGAGMGIDRDPANLAGMQKNYNGEAIGVAGDSIFRMMTRRYKVKESQRSFYDESDISR